MSRSRAAALAVSVIAAATLTGCGSAATPKSGSAEDAALAAKIRESAAQRQSETATATVDDPYAPKLPTDPELPGAAELPSTVELPAGSEEIDGPTTVTNPQSKRSAAIFSAADRASFRRLAADLPGQEGVATTGLGVRGAVESLGDLRSAVAWSTAKLPVAMAAIRAGTANQGDLTAAITASDNAAAERLWSSLGDPAAAAAAATQAVRDSGDGTTTIEADRLRAGFTAFGQTGWALADQARFVAGMSCATAGPEVLGLMDQVVAGQRWGLGATGHDAQFKGGWGPGVTPGTGDGWLDRQVGILTLDGRPVAIAIASTAASHGQGTSALTRLARWVAEHASTGSLPARPRC